MYKRKTRDEFDVEIDYGQGYEVVTCEETPREARQRAREYRDNSLPFHPIRIVHRRVKIEQEGVHNAS